jgi:ABC-type Mn2+/Zn2+ transport system ATPase subunit
MQWRRRSAAGSRAARSPGSDEALLCEVADLAVGYPGGPIVLEDVSFAVRAGMLVGVLGPNGGGKSTLLRTLLGDLRPRAGRVVTEGRLGFVPQTDRSRLDYPVSARDVALMGSLTGRAWWRPPGRDDRRATADALARVGLTELADEPFGELSGGQRQRVLIARALVQDARLLLLDEPFAGLDLPGSDRLLQVLDDLSDDGCSALVAVHDVDQARRWDRVLCLNRRQVAFGEPATILTSRVLELTYGGAITLGGHEVDHLAPTASHRVARPGG